jgi:hypothetical protein
VTNPVSRVLYRDAALADGRSDRLQLGMSVLVEGDRITWIRPTDAEEDPDDRVDVVDVISDALWRVSWSPDPVAV